GRAGLFWVTSESPWSPCGDVRKSEPKRYARDHRSQTRSGYHRQWTGFMEAFTQTSLLDVCWTSMPSGQLDTVAESALRGWWPFERQRVAPLVDAFIPRPTTEWLDAILSHRAHRHPWYDALALEVTPAEFAAFMLENRRFPA